MMARIETKAAVLAAMTSIGREAKAQGDDAWTAIAKAVPDAPSDVVAEAYLALEDEASAAWWEQVEKTIDGELVRHALGLENGERA